MAGALSFGLLKQCSYAGFWSAEGDGAILAEYLAEDSHSDVTVENQTWRANAARREIKKARPTDFSGLRRRDFEWEVKQFSGGATTRRFLSPQSGDAAATHHSESACSVGDPNITLTPRQCQLLNAMNVTGCLNGALSRSSESLEGIGCPTNISSLRSMFEAFVFELTRGNYFTQLTAERDYVTLFCQLMEDLHAITVDQNSGRKIEFPLFDVVRIYLLRRAHRRPSGRLSQKSPPAEPVTRLSSHGLQIPRLDLSAVADASPDHLVVVDFPSRKLAFVFEDYDEATRFRFCMEVLVACVKDLHDGRKARRRLLLQTPFRPCDPPSRGSFRRLTAARAIRCSPAPSFCAFLEEPTDIGTAESANGYAERNGEVRGQCLSRLNNRRDTAEEPKEEELPAINLFDHLEANNALDYVLSVLDKEQDSSATRTKLQFLYRRSQSSKRRQPPAGRSVPSPTALSRPRASVSSYYSPAFSLTSSPESSPNQSPKSAAAQPAELIPTGLQQAGCHLQVGRSLQTRTSSGEGRDGDDWMRHDCLPVVDLVERTSKLFSAYPTAEVELEKSGAAAETDSSNADELSITSAQSLEFELRKGSKTAGERWWHEVRRQHRTELQVASARERSVECHGLVAGDAACNATQSSIAESNCDCNVQRGPENKLSPSNNPQRLLKDSQYKDSLEFWLSGESARFVSQQIPAGAPDVPDLSPGGRPTSDPCITSSHWKLVPHCPLIVESVES